MLVRASKFLAILFLSQLLLTGCPSSRSILVTLLVDYSDSNRTVNEKEGKVPERICQQTASAILETSGSLSVGRFDSIFPYPQSLQQSTRLTRTEDKDRFVERVCSKLMKKGKDFEPREGTDVYKAWAVFRQAYEERQQSLKQSQKETESKEAELVLIVLDSLEKSEQGKDQKNFDQFKESVSNFTKTGNRVVFFVNRDRDRDALAGKLPLSGTEIYSYDDPELTIDSVFSSMRSQ